MELTDYKIMKQEWCDQIDNLDKIASEMKKHNQRLQIIYILLVVSLFFINICLLVFMFELKIAFLNVSDTIKSSLSMLNTMIVNDSKMIISYLESNFTLRVKIEV